MTFKEAARFKMPFCKYTGKTLEEIASDNVGLEYLDWLRMVRQGKYMEDVDKALAAYLNGPSIKKELGNA